ncbi:hypothetical protein BASA50_010790 [Batrachochytrium salamandrivorans]|uniref:Extracellular membrane protein CFEM domain-containing protein n=1 Tax=Batrachochytrium salamandrivorans TaxID=1357716 RepID=A0ABQ8EY12_9FUNG|nr:hypothetical protein BASA62_001888 [Batrachochytrium salamandrivorans]KAH6588312.1 hypothetical protein BASA50_010787 [Batrachochytrium salamandrivorans]KAH6588315.1 hypothetical protein BASA50_010790 [Batrachochytrium salamandrivorans]KAH6591671.1 hypothetical protein BASA61_004870 [Batrachochytrium salamandrivorans]KAH9268452.1 hypothetical protein BASA83_009294 [Batrachochytrium salamandrivorans]
MFFAAAAAVSAAPISVPNMPSGSLVCTVGAQRCIENTTTGLQSLFETCIQSAAEDITWVALLCRQGTTCKPYPGNSDYVYCG